MLTEEKEKLSSIFLELGCQYYAIARYCTTVLFLPVGITMFHHAIEMLLKGYLVKHHTLRILKSVGHNLVKLWDMFTTLQGNHLKQFDKTIAHLDKTELLRYPDGIVNQGFVLNVRLGNPIPIKHDKTKGVPQYSVNVLDLDKIACAIFSACQVHPKNCFRNTPSNMINTLPPIFRPY